MLVAPPHGGDEKLVGKSMVSAPNQNFSNSQSALAVDTPSATQYTSDYGSTADSEWSFSPPSLKKKKHARIPKEETCQICGNVFYDKATLKSHMNTHRAYHERPYQCSICGLRYCSKMNLNRHMRKNHAKSA